MSDVHILVVDDSPVNVRLLTYLLEAAGHHVEAASTGRAALEAVARRPPDLIMMDVQLPDIDGLTLTRQLKDDPATAGIVIVAVTAYAMHEDELRARDAGCDAYLTKPVQVRTLAATVADILERGPRRAG